MDYVSNLLCHFVGRAQTTEEQQFQLLVKIIKQDKTLLANLKNPNKLTTSTSFHYSGARVGEMYERCDCVCFCDIPDESLGIHVNKYGRFGMGFDKSFLISKGVRPVMYIPQKVEIKERAKTDTPKQAIEYYQYLAKELSCFLVFLNLLNSCMPFKNCYQAMKESSSPAIQQALKFLNEDALKKVEEGKAHSLIFGDMMAWSTQLSYIKVFDATLSPDDPDNYYMEREWRSIENINFELSDILKIYLPCENYKKRFMKEFPTYKGEFCFLNKTI